MAYTKYDGQYDRANLIGVSGVYTGGPWRFAAKIEQLLSDDAVIENKDLIVFNLYRSYTVDKLTYKAMCASGDGEAGKNDEDDVFLIGPLIILCRLPTY